MKKFSNYEETSATTESPKLPKGAYVLTIKSVEEITYSWGEVLKFDFDILEGEYKGFYQKQYNSNEQEDKKWKGSFRLNIPKDDGSEMDAFTKSKFKAAMMAFEESNPGFKWAWDERMLVGKTVGGAFNLKEWEYNGNSGWFTQCKYFVAASKVRSNDVTLPKDEPLKNKTVAASSNNAFGNVEDNEEIPFN